MEKSNVFKKYNLKSEKAGVTLYVLIAMLFFTIILVSTFLGLQSSKNSQEESYQAMKSEYEEDVDNLEEIYNQAKQDNELWTKLLNKSTNGSWDNLNRVNSPKLAEGMTAIELTTDYKAGKEWYDYVAADKTKMGTSDGDTKQSRWANAMTDDGSYWVWIPRFAYKITAKGDSDAAGRIEVVFLKDDTDVYIDENGDEQTATRWTGTSVTTTDTDYIVHPAFTTDTANGGWDKELTGIWVAKFEMSQEKDGENVNTDSTPGNIGIEKVGTKGTAGVTMASKPNAYSWININIANCYTNSYYYDRAKESHLMKNSEWGAVAYLTHSQYGRNGNEIYQNKSTSYITGSSNGTVSQDATTNPQYAYNVEGSGTGASTTGNIYGIYDMSGGVFEYVASYNTSHSGTYYTGDNYLDVNGKNFANELNNQTEANKKYNEYVTAYASTSSTPSEATAKKGDATYETSGWNGDNAYFVNSVGPFFIRGGYCIDDTNAGVFYFTNFDGDAISFVGFRVCLAVE